ncbi:hypothetical protein ACJMK2_014941 [Sinanodonta woodiana]|uniref:Lipocalin n=1 Tax=Sinanodonta woodiana TaxID=1069815 RepID=A0ABD3V435_SINWO
MKCIIILTVLVGLSYQMTTPHNIRTTHEPSVTQQYIFHYDYLTHKMVVHKDKNCYIFTLTDQERIDVHTDSGLTALEVQFLTRISANAHTEVTRTSLETSVRTACGFNIQHFYTVA